MVEPNVYLEKLSAFSRLLRLEGLTVGPGETADAARILTEIGLADKALVQTALRTVFAKSRDEQVVFDRVFGNFFVSEEVMRQRAEEARQQAEEEARQAAENAKLKLDMSRLDQIRKDAAVTRDKLIVEEEMAEEPAAPAPVETPEPDTPLSKAEYRYLQCLLYGRPTDWVRSEGLMVSVLTDGINEKLYDTFCDSVLEEGEVVADYTEDLKEMVLP